MESILEPLRRFFAPRHKIPAGIYHYQAPPDDPRNYRLHLRVEENGDGLLIVNAATILHLNHTAAEYAYYLVQNTPVDEVARRMSTRYHVGAEQARQDYQDLSERIRTLIEVPDLDPVTFLDFERVQPFSGRWSAPLRLDCAITYRLPATEAADSAPVERVKAELSTEEWKTILSKAWEAGIPHIIFTGGEPTLRDDLVELIVHAEELGQVSGLLSDGLRLADRAYLEQLLQAGLDHLLLTLQPESDASWEAVNNAMVEDLSVTVHLTITDAIRDQAKAILQRLADLGVKKISLSANDPKLADAMQAVREHAATLGLELIWNIPVPYSSVHPVAFETGDAQIEGAGRAWLYVEPDGDVLAGQGNPKVLGNFLNDPWEKIWNR
jgi:organic radical activating enzyme